MGSVQAGQAERIDSAVARATERRRDFFHSQLEQQLAKPHPAAIQTLENFEHILFVMTDAGCSQLLLTNHADAVQPSSDLGVIRIAEVCGGCERNGEPIELVSIVGVARIQRHQLFDRN